MPYFLKKIKLKILKFNFINPKYFLHNTKPSEIIIIILAEDTK